MMGVGEDGRTTIQGACPLGTPPGGGDVRAKHVVGRCAHHSGAKTQAAALSCRGVTFAATHNEDCFLGHAVGHEEKGRLVLVRSPVPDDELVPVAAGASKINVKRVNRHD